MGKGKRVRPRFLGNKLREIRSRLRFSQNEMLRALGLDDEFTRSELSAYERGIREPPLQVLLAYSKAAGVWLNVLADDGLELPQSLRPNRMHGGIRRRSRVERQR